MLDVVTFGSATKDTFLFVKDGELKPGINKHFLEVPLDKKLDVKNVLEFTGGSATNAAATFSKFGKRVGIVTKIGSDEAGDFVLNDMRRRGVSTDYIVTSSGATAFTTVIVSSNMQMVLLVYRGAEESLKKEEVPLRFESRWMYIGPLTGESYKLLPPVVEYCKANNIRISMNPGSTELSQKLKKMIPILKDVDVISMNDEEARTFVGYNNDTKNLIRLARAVKDIAIITRGDKGVMVANRKYVYNAEAFKTKQINFVGAGDAFLSGFINALMDEKSVEDAINLGSYNASGVVKAYGAKDGIADGYPKQKLKIRRVEYESKQA